MDEFNNVVLPERIVLNGNVHNLIEETYGSTIAEERWHDMTKRVIMAPMNVTVDMINKEVLKK